MGTAFCGLCKQVVAALVVVAFVALCTHLFFHHRRRRHRHRHRRRFSLFIYFTFIFLYSRRLVSHARNHVSDPQAPDPCQTFRYTRTALPAGRVDCKSGFNMSTN